MRFRITGRRKQHRVHKTKDCGIRADAKREHENGGDGETRRFDQLPTGESEIMNHNFRWDAERTHLGFNKFSESALKVVPVIPNRVDGEGSHKCRSSSEAIWVSGGLW